MLQFITTGSSRFSTAEEAQMVLEGGCRWIQLSEKGLAGQETILRDVASEIAVMCQEHEAFLIIEDDIDLVEDMKVHGLFMHDNSRESVMTARERLGANAVIGVAAKSAAEIKHLIGLDVDYVMVPVPENCTDIHEFYSDIVRRLTVENIDFHVVACGNISIADFAPLLKAGCAGVAVSEEITEASDPVATTVANMEALKKAREAADDLM